MGADRRTVLLATAATLAGCSVLSRETPTETLTPAAVPDAPPETDAPSRLVTVHVGRDGVGFDPPRVRVPAGTRVRWVWASDGHNIDVLDRPVGADWNGTERGRLFDEGSDHGHEFRVPGAYEYRCSAHETRGGRGALLVVPLADPLVSVGADGPGFGPARLHVDPGTTVTWFWESDDHSLVVDWGPVGVDWRGTTGERHEAGYVHRHTFRASGVYRYRCDNHGSVGYVLVGDATPALGPG